MLNDRNNTFCTSRRRRHWTRSFLWKEIKPRSKNTTIREAKPLLLIHLNDNMSRTIAGILVLLPFSPFIFWQQDTPKWVFQICPGAVGLFWVSAIGALRKADHARVCRAQSWPAALEVFLGYCSSQLTRTIYFLENLPEECKLMTNYDRVKEKKNKGRRKACIFLAKIHNI